MKMFRGCLVLIFILFLSSIPALADDKSLERQPPLPQEHIRKLKRIAVFIAAELQRRPVKSVTVEDFTDFHKRPSATGTRMAREFSRQLAALGDKKFMVVEAGAEAIVAGTLVPFKDGGKWKLDIKVVSADKGKIITTYTGILKKARPAKK